MVHEEKAATQNGFSQGRMKASHRGVRFGTLSVAGRPRTKRGAIFSSRSVAEVAHARHNHRHPLLVCGFDDFGIANRSTRLNNRRDSRLHGSI